MSDQPTEKPDECTLAGWHQSEGVWGSDEHGTPIVRWSCCGEIDYPLGFYS